MSMVSGCVAHSESFEDLENIALIGPEDEHGFGECYPPLQLHSSSFIYHFTLHKPRVATTHSFCHGLEPYQETSEYTASLLQRCQDSSGLESERLSGSRTTLGTSGVRHARYALTTKHAKYGTRYTRGNKYAGRITGYTRWGK